MGCDFLSVNLCEHWNSFSLLFPSNSEHYLHPGLRYEDLLIEENREVQEALELADPAVQTARTRRIKRAIDLSYKKKSMKDYAPDQDNDMFKKEIYVDIEKIRQRDQEYAQLNAHNKM